MSRPRGRMLSERRWGMGKIGKGEHSSTRFGARTRMFEADFGWSHGWRRPKAHRCVPLDKRVSRRYPTSVGRISGGGRSIGDFSLTTQRKVTRPSPKGGRNPVEGRALAFHAAQPLKRGQPLARESGESLPSWNGRFPAVQCVALIAPYGATTSTPRTSDYASLIRPTRVAPTRDGG